MNYGNYNYYDYKKLLRKALSAKATQKDINTLGMWFNSFGLDFWNGEYFDMENGKKLCPVFVETGTGDFDVIKFEIV